MDKQETETYYTVTLKVYAFDTKEEARTYMDKLIDAFCEMPESKDYGSSAWIEGEKDSND